MAHLVNRHKFKSSVINCAKDHVGKNELNRQFKSIYLKIKFACTFCSSKFTNKASRDNHILSEHPVEKRFKSELYPLPAKFSAPKRFIDHRNAHKAEKPHKCFKQFQRRDNLNSHMKSVHFQNRRRKFSCSTCNKTFFWRNSLKRHTLIHGQDVDKFGCYFCKKRFNRKSILHDQIRTHTTEKPFLCYVDSCNYSSTCSRNLVSHKRARHSSAEGIPQRQIRTCYFCYKTFSVLRSLHNHLRLHTREIPFICGLCNKHVRTQRMLQHHISNHTMERPFKCGECQKSFTYHNVLQHHIGGVHRKEKHFFCKLCNFSSYGKNILDRHNLRHCKNIL